MKSVLVDSNVLLDLFLNDPKWADWSANMLQTYVEDHQLLLNAVIYSEVSIAFEKIETLETALQECGFNMRPIPREALFLAGKVFLQYRRNAGARKSPLPDFFIGAHAAIEKVPLITRDRNRFKGYFPSVKIISPN